MHGVWHYRRWHADAAAHQWTVCRIGVIQVALNTETTSSTLIRPIGLVCSNVIVSKQTIVLCWECESRQGTMAWNSWVVLVCVESFHFVAACVGFRLVDTGFRNFWWILWISWISIFRPTASPTSGFNFFTPITSAMLCYIMLCGFQDTPFVTLGIVPLDMGVVRGLYVSPS